MFWEEAHRVNEKLSSFAWVGFIFLGLGLIRLWLLNLHAANLVSSAIPAQSLDAVFRWVQIIALMVLALLARKIRSLHHNGVVFLGSIAAMVVGAALLGLPEFIGFNAILAVIGIMLSAIGYSAMLLLWFELYGCLNSASMVVAYAGSNIVAALFWRLLSSLDAGVAFAVVLLLPIAAGLCLLRGFHSPSAQRESQLVESRSTAFPPISTYWRLLAGISCFSLAAGYFSAGSVRMGISMAAYALTGLLVIAGMVLFNKSFDSSILYRISLPFIIAGLIVAPLINLDSDLVRLLISLGKECTLTIALVIAGNEAYRRRVSSAYLSGFIYAINMVALLCGTALKRVVAAIGGTSGVTEYIAIVVLSLLCILVSTLIFNENHFIQHWEETGLSTKGTRSRRERQDEARQRFTAKYNLSPREEEIILLLAQGKSNQEIGDELFIAAGTVRTHVSRIYTKLDIHDKDSLQSLLEQSNLI